ncbi:MAG: flagellar export protein FliJ [Gammaproteobacteria bacterium]
MKREQRIDGYRASLEGTERERAARAQLADRRVREARTRPEELERYRSDYRSGLGQRVAGGMAGPALRDYHAFLGRLGDAIVQQRQVIARCESERDFDQQRWREIAVQLKAVSAVVERWRGEERVVESRAEQRAIDERATLARHAAALEV